MEFLITNVAPIAFLFFLLVFFLFPKKFYFWYFVLRATVQPMILDARQLFGVLPVSMIGPILICANWVRMLFSSKYKLFTPETLFFFGIVFFSLLSTIVNGVFSQAIPYVIRLLVIVLSMQACYALAQDQETSKTVLKGIIIGSVLINVYAIPQVLSGMGDITGLIEDKNSYGIYLAFIIIILSHLALTTKNKVVLLILLATIVLFILSKNRGSWVALWVAIFVSCIKYRHQIKFGYILTGLIVIPLLFSPVIYERFLDLSRFDEWGNSRDNLAGRFEAWKQYFYLFLERPLFGFGPNVGSMQIGLRPHNDYVRLAVDSGFFSIIFYMLFLFTSLIRCLKKKKSVLTLFQLSAVIFIIIISIAQNIIYSNLIMPIFYFFLTLPEPVPQTDSPPDELQIKMNKYKILQR